MNQNENFDAEALLEELSLASPVVNGIWYFIREKDYAAARKAFVEEGVSKENAKKLVEYLREKYCGPIELIEIKIDEIDTTKVMNRENYDSKDLPQYMVRSGGMMHQSPLAEYTYNKEYKELVFYLGSQMVPIKKIDQVWKIVSKTKKVKNEKK